MNCILPYKVNVCRLIIRSITRFASEEIDAAILVNYVTHTMNLTGCLTLPSHCVIYSKPF